jgi:hypothetical protein
MTGTATTGAGNDRNRQRLNAGILHCVQDDDFKKLMTTYKTEGDVKLRAA